ncbi:hypothetical protein STCU_10990 [Strigomonas culicis]|uniref:Uncharacterized protein n=1 Tax=Strigomonas culicis TaxID=28005 RepID=S9TKA8_9TRYP|nr:hypothetical protein STCU_10990 [Strigomonas culicis]|eukprot:EPY16788.1 hypothetical protein STCU_10990 [Strigomonas culicis]
MFSKALQHIERRLDEVTTMVQHQQQLSPRSSSRRYSLTAGAPAAAATPPAAAPHRSSRRGSKQMTAEVTPNTASGSFSSNNAPHSKYVDAWAGGHRHAS